MGTFTAPPDLESLRRYASQLHHDLTKLTGLTLSLFLDLMAATVDPRRDTEGHVEYWFPGWLGDRLIQGLGQAER